MHYNAALVLLIVALGAPFLVVLAGTIQLRLASPTAIAVTALAFAITIASYWTGEDRFDAIWVSEWNLRFTIALDGLARLYAMLATGIGLAVVVYSAKYLPLHLHHEHRPQAEIVRFHFFLLLFMGAMVGLVTAQDVILLFLFWDLTAIASFFLIGFDREKEDSRLAAQMALLVTGISAVLLLIGAVLLWHEHGSMDLRAILASDLDNGYAATAAVFIAIAALAKSAQVPLHFWLPKAMAAPTPVSAYLHSAAMVAAGVFLIGRMYPLMERFDWLLDGFVIVGLLSMAIGGILALTRDVLKQVLAYSTISQYGYVVFLFGLGGEHGAAAATFYVIAHALSKSALFLTAGAVTEATGQTGLSGVGGLATRMPLLAAGSGAAAAGLIALPLTSGFFKDEFYFETAWERGTLFGVAAVVGAALTFAYISRFWLGVFGSVRAGVPIKKEPTAISGVLVWPVVLLGVTVIAGGIWTTPLVRMAEEAATITAGHEVHLHGTYHLDVRAANVMALASWGLGIALYLGRRFWWPAAMGVSRLGRRFGPERIYNTAISLLNQLSDQLHVFEVRDPAACGNPRRYRCLRDAEQQRVRGWRDLVRRCAIDPDADAGDVRGAGDFRTARSPQLGPGALVRRLQPLRALCIHRCAERGTGRGADRDGLLAALHRDADPDATLDPALRNGAPAGAIPHPP
jgi:multicomponent Na+:H+ antiporter subunit A